MVADANTYVCTFSPDIAMQEVSDTLALAVVAAASIYGESAAQLDAIFGADHDRRQVMIDATTDVGRGIARAFIGFSRVEFGENAFKVDRSGSSRGSAPRLSPLEPD